MQATANAMSEKEQRSYKRHPFNIKRGFVDGQLKIDQEALVVDVGNVQFTTDSFIIKVNQDELLSLGFSKTGQIELSSSLYSKHDNLIARIERMSGRQGYKCHGIFSQPGGGYDSNERYDVSIEINARKYSSNTWESVETFPAFRASE